MTDELDIRYASFRDHAEVRERLVALETGLRTDVSEIKAMLMRPVTSAQQQVDHTALAIQRVMDTVDRKLTTAVTPAAGGSTIMRALAIIGAFSMGAVGMYFVLGHH